MGAACKLRRLQELADKHFASVELTDGSVVRFDAAVIVACLMNVMERERAARRGEEPPPEHPFIETLRRAKDLDALVKEQGQMVRAVVGGRFGEE